MEAIDLLRERSSEGERNDAKTVGKRMKSLEKIGTLAKFSWEVLLGIGLHALTWVLL